MLFIHPFRTSQQPTRKKTPCRNVPGLGRLTVIGRANHTGAGRKPQAELGPLSGVGTTESGMGGASSIESANRGILSHAVA